MRVEGVPSPASRPRVTQYGTFYTKPYQEWLAACQQQIAKARSATLAGLLWCAVEIIVPRPKTTKLHTPRGDADNYVKGVLDGGTKAGAWGDDSQIVLLVSLKRFSDPGEAPGAIIRVGELN